MQHHGISPVTATADKRHEKEAQRKMEKVESLVTKQNRYQTDKLGARRFGSNRFDFWVRNFPGGNKKNLFLSGKFGERSSEIEGERERKREIWVEKDDFENLGF